MLDTLAKSICVIERVRAMVKLVVYVLFATFLLAPANTLDQEEAAELLKIGVEDYIKGRRSTNLNVAFKTFQFPGLFTRIFDSAKNVGVCLACEAVAPGFITTARLPFSTVLLKPLMTTLCTGMRIQNQMVCDSIIDLHLRVLVEVIKKTPSLTSSRLCSIVFQDYGCIDLFRRDWTVNIPAKNINTGNHQGDEDEQNFKILQLTDVHYSLDYAVGSNAVCGNPMCCEAPSTPSKPEDAAGKWGDYRDCDLSLEVIETSLEHIVAEHPDIDYMYFVGDIVDHKSWASSIPRNKIAISRFWNLLKSKFPQIHVLPVLGNHETHPVNVFAPHQPNLVSNTQWLFDFTQEQWSWWLPDDTAETILTGGFYTVLIRVGFRVISLNNNVCGIYNWWLLHNDEDPYGQLEWLVDVLAEAEQNNEKVHILSHIPSGDPTCLSNWGREYSRIVSRFSDTITAQFNGHTHTIENTIYFTNEIPVSIAFNGGSLTPYFNVNPNYAVFSVNRATLAVVDYDVWIYDVAEANSHPNVPPRWFKLFSFKDAYNMNSLHPSEVYELVKRMSRDHVLQDQYFRYKYKNATPYISEGCDHQCNYVNLCNMVTSHYKIYNADCPSVQ